MFFYKTGVNTLAIQSEDTVPTLFTTVAILKGDGLFLGDYYDYMLSQYPQPDDKDQTRRLTPYYLKKIPTTESLYTEDETYEYVSAFTIMPAILSLPVFALPVWFGMPITFDNLAILGHLTSAILVSLSGVTLFLLLKKHFSLEEKKVSLLSYVYLFGTINFALLSQALWQHGIVELFVILALYMFFEKRWFFMSLSLGLAILTRPTALLFVPYLGLLMVSVTFSEKTEDQIMQRLTGVRNKIEMWTSYVLGFLPAVLFFIWYNKTYYLNLSNQGYSSQLTSWLSPFPEGFIGMWLSPSKGILIYSPILIFMFFGLYQGVKNTSWKTERGLQYVTFGCIVLVHTLILSVWKHWYGGYGFGYRMASDVLPFMVLLMVPHVRSMYFEKTKKLFFVLFGFSVLMQLQGMIFFDSIWHNAYDQGFKNTAWLWSIKNSETAFNIRRILVKFGLLEKACEVCL